MKTKTATSGPATKPMKGRNRPGFASSSWSGILADRTADNAEVCRFRFESYGKKIPRRTRRLGAERRERARVRTRSSAEKSPGSLSAARRNDQAGDSGRSRPGWPPSFRDVSSRFDGLVECSGSNWLGKLSGSHIQRSVRRLSFIRCDRASLASAAWRRLVARHFRASIRIARAAWLKSST